MNTRGRQQPTQALEAEKHVRSRLQSERSAKCFCRGIIAAAPLQARWARRVWLHHSVESLTFALPIPTDEVDRIDAGECTIRVACDRIALAGHRSQRCRQIPISFAHAPRGRRRALRGLSP